MQTELTGALKQGCALREIYTDLRGVQSDAERVSLLRRAEQCADAMSTVLCSWSQTSPSEPMKDEVRAALNGLGAIMEQVMVLEREYRIASGAAPWRTREDRRSEGASG